MISKRKLLAVGHSYVVRANRKLPEAILRAGKGRWEVEIVAPSYFHGANDLRPVTLDRSEDELTVHAVGTRFSRSRHLFSYHHAALQKVMLNRPWDIIHAWEEPYVLAGAQLAASTPRGIPFVFRSAQSLNKWYPPPFNLFERYAVSRAAGWLCSGTLVADNLRRRLNYGALPNACIPLGVDVEEFHHDDAKKLASMRKLGWNYSGPPVVGFLGRFAPEKGIDLLMTALDEIKTPWRALFVGAGALESKLRAWTSRYSDDRIRICTNVTHEQVPNYLSTMDILAAPSQTTKFWKEQFGRMLVEGMAAGLPVIGSDSGEIPFVIDDAGLVLPEAEPQIWTNAIGDLLESPSRRLEYAKRSRERAISLFDWNVVGKSHLRFCEKLLDDRQDGTHP